MLFILTNSLQKLKLQKFHGTLIIFLCRLDFFSATNTFIFLLKKKKKNRFKENANTFSKISITQENITISRQNFLFLLKAQKKSNQFSGSYWWGNTKSSFKEIGNHHSRKY